MTDEKAKASNEFREWLKNCGVDPTAVDQADGKELFFVACMVHAGHAPSKLFPKLTLDWDSWDSYER